MKKTLLAAAAAGGLTAAAHAQGASDPGGVIHGGQILADVISWGSMAFGTALATFVTALVYKAMNWMGLQVSAAQRDQLQQIVINGLNEAAAKAQGQLRGNAMLDVQVKNQIVADATAYVQAHAGDTIRALGLDPDSGAAVQAIRARIASAIVDPKVPTDPKITPIASGGDVK